MHNNLLKTAEGYLHNAFEDIVLLVWGLFFFSDWEILSSLLLWTLSKDTASFAWPVVYGCIDVQLADLVPLFVIEKLD